MSKEIPAPTTRIESRFTLRMSAELLEKVRVSAQKNKRSTAKEIEFILEKYFEKEKSN